MEILAPLSGTLNKEVSTSQLVTRRGRSHVKTPSGEEAVFLKRGRIFRTLPFDPGVARRRTHEGGCIFPQKTEKEDAILQEQEAANLG